MLRNPSDLLLHFTNDPVHGDRVAVEGPRELRVEPVKLDRARLDAAYALALPFLDGASLAGQDALGDALWKTLPKSIVAGIERYLTLGAGEIPRARILWHFEERSSARFLPWEAMVYGAKLRPSRTRRAAPVRFVATSGAGASPFRAQERARVLVLVGNQYQLPKNQSADSSVQAAITSVESALRASGLDYELVIAGAQRWVPGSGTPQPLEYLGSLDAIARFLQDDREGFPIVFYLGHSAHGSPKPTLEERLRAEPDAITRGLSFWFRSEGAPDTLRVFERGDDPPSLTELFAAARTRVLVLGACLVDDGLGQELVRAVEHVIATPQKVTPELAGSFVAAVAQALYGPRASGSVSGALLEARATLAPDPKLAHDVDLFAHWSSALDDAWLQHAAAAAIEAYAQRLDVELRASRNPLVTRLDHGQREVLVETFVDLGLEASREDFESFPERVDLRRLLDLVPRHGRRRWVVLGGATDGKTTSLRRAAHQLLEEHPRRMLPFVLEAQQLAREKLGSVRALAAFVPELQSVSPEIESLVRRGRLAVFVDAWDELPEELRATAERMLRELASELGRSALIVACREVDYRELDLGGITAAERAEQKLRSVRLLPLDKPERDRLAGNWIQRLWDQPQRSESLPALDAYTKPQDAADALLQRIERSTALLEIARNPLAVALLALLFAKGRAFPDERRQVYDLFLDYLLTCRHRGGTDLSQDQRAGALRFLRKLARRLFDLGRIDLEGADATLGEDEGPFERSCVELWSELGPLAPWSSAQDLRAFLAHPAGIFVRKSRDRYGFALTVFRDHLAAHALFEQEYARGGLYALQPLLQDASKRAARSEAFALLTEYLPASDVARWIKTLEQIDLRLALRALARADLGEVLDAQILRILGLAYPGKLRETLRSIIASLSSDDEANLLVLLRRAASLTRNAEILFALDEILRAHAWSSEGRRGEANRLVDERLKQIPAPPPALLSKQHFVQIPTPREFRKENGERPIQAGLEPDWFWMGSPENEEGRYPDEERHPVKLVQALWMGITPVTVAQYRAFDPDLQCPGSDDHPVTRVSWNAIQIFLRWLRAHGWKVDLPTEAQWEWSARGGTTTRFWSGDNESDLAGVGWYDANAKVEIHPVGQKPANPFGLQDVHGNVWEWSRDGYEDYPERDEDGDRLRVAPAAAPRRRVLRGGSRWDVARDARSADRNWSDPEFADVNFGFRLALSAPPPGP